MKKKLLTLLAALFMGVLSAFTQDVIPNGSFEQWDQENPVNWMQLYGINNFHNVFQSGDAQEGSSSVELKPVYNSLYQGTPAAWLNSETFPITAAHNALHGYYKGSAIGEDSLTVLISVFEDASPVGWGFFVTGASKPSWTAFSVPITYYTDAVPDEAIITMILGTQNETGNEGSSYLIDNLTFGGSAGLNDLRKVTDYTIFPNPVADRINARFTLEDADKMSFSLISPQGTVVYQSNFQIFGQGQNTFTLPVDDVAQGIYFLQATGKKYHFTHKVMINR